MATQKPTINVATIGQAGHGKTTLTVALARVCPKIFRSAIVDFDKLKSPGPQKKIADIYCVEYDSAKRHYVNSDCSSRADVIASAGQMHGAILVCSTADGPALQTREHLQLCSQLGVKYIVVFLNKADLVNDAELLELLETEVRNLLSNCGFPGDEIPIITGSARIAEEAEGDNEMGTQAVRKLIEALDTYIPDPL